MAFRKILDNAGLKAARLLGMRQYLTMLWNLMGSLPAILRQKNLVALDKRMSDSVLILHFKSQRYLIDLPYIDSHIIEDCFAYGGVREIFIRNCYFRYHDIDFSNLKTIVDLGGNRGLFSTLCAPFATKIITVEPNQTYNMVITTNIKNANPSIQPVIINRFVGSSGLVERTDDCNVSLDRIMSDHDIELIDFLKIDIEGSEFSLFEEGLPFGRIRYLSMEVHRDYGDPLSLIRTLKSNHFNVVSCTSDFELTDASNEIDYIYARNTTV